MQYFTLLLSAVSFPSFNVATAAPGQAQLQVFVSTSTQMSNGLFTESCTTRNIKHTRTAPVTSTTSPTNVQISTTKTQATTTVKRFTNPDPAGTTTTFFSTVTITSTPASKSITVTKHAVVTQKITKTETVTGYYDTYTVTPATTVVAPAPTGFVDIQNSTHLDDPDVVCADYYPVFISIYLTTIYYSTQKYQTTHSITSPAPITKTITAPHVPTYTSTITHTSTRSTIVSTIRETLLTISIVQATGLATVTAYPSVCGAASNNYATLNDRAVAPVLPSTAYTVQTIAYANGYNNGGQDCCNACAGTPGCLFGYYFIFDFEYDPSCNLYVAEAGKCPNKAGPVFAGRVNETAKVDYEGDVFFNGPCGFLTL